MTKKNRPISLNIINIKFPLTAIASISHRISGVAIFIVIGILLITLKFSLLSKDCFHKIKLIMNYIFIKFMIWCILIFFIYHSINGFRSILMDIGYLNKTLKIGQKSANVVFILTGLLSVCIGYLLC